VLRLTPTLNTAPTGNTAVRLGLGRELLSQFVVLLWSATGPRLPCSHSLLPREATLPLSVEDAKILADLNKEADVEVEKRLKAKELEEKELKEKMAVD
jgi:hypothetical protein